MALASVWCLQSHVFDALVASPFYNKEAQKLTKFKRMRVPCCGINQHNHQKQSAAIQDPFGISKRQCLLQTVIAAISLPPFVSVALAAGDNVPEDFRLYSDELNKFKLMIPQDWQVGTGENNGVKSLTGFFPAKPSGSNITVVISGLGADFTRLESFGKVDAFAENLVSGLDRSWQRPPGVAAKLIDSKAANGLYYIEYTLQNPGESRRHLYSVLGIANNGWYNRLYTVTGQFLDEESEKYGSQIEKAVASFRLTRENNAGLGVNF